MRRREAVPLVIGGGVERPAGVVAGGPSTVTMTAPNPVISVSGLVKTFGTTRALNGLDLTVASGEVHGYSARTAQILPLVGAGLVQLPAIGVLATAVLLAVGLVQRAAVAVAWSAVVA